MYTSPLQRANLPTQVSSPHLHFPVVYLANVLFPPKTIAKAASSPPLHSPPLILVRFSWVTHLLLPYHAVMFLIIAVQLSSTSNACSASCPFVLVDDTPFA